MRFDPRLAVPFTTEKFHGRVARNIQQNHNVVPCNPNSAGYCRCPNEIVADSDEADVITSQLKIAPTYHMPVIDIDFPCELIESATPGHFHLYINKAVPKEEYLAMLKAMADAGIVEWGYYDASCERGYSAVRHPDRPKKRKVQQIREDQQ